mgnify:CR=1 FL=1|jgi:hypothetical protein|tara:strand:+ start:1285 stop:1584 length:300 start_codon:yes stop_codon:yes gene_type:complete
MCNNGIIQLDKELSIMENLGHDIQKQITLITKHDDRHGGPYDRGSADSYYGRGTKPHYFVGGTHQTDKIEEKDMTQSEIDAYYAGFEDNEADGSFKDWG